MRAFSKFAPALGFRGKFLLGYGLCWSLLALTAIVVGAQLSDSLRIRGEIARARYAMDEIRFLSEDLWVMENGVRRFLLTGEGSSFSDSVEADTRFDQRIQTSRNAVKEFPGMESRIVRLGVLKTEWQQGSVSQARAARGRLDGGAITHKDFEFQVSESKLGTGAQVIREDLDAMSDGLIQAVSVADQGASRLEYRTLWTGLGGLVLALLSGGVTVWASLNRFRGDVQSRIKKIERYAEEVKILAIQVKKEPELAAESVRKMTEFVTRMRPSLDQSLEGFRKNSEKVTQLAEHCDQARQAVLSGVSEIEKADRARAQLVRSLEEVRGRFSEIPNLSKELSEKMKVVSELATQLKLGAVNSSIVASGMNAGGKESSLLALAEDLVRLSEQGNQVVREIPSSIEGGAQRSKLLAGELDGVLGRITSELNGIALESSTGPVSVMIEKGGHTLSGVRESLEDFGRENQQRATDLEREIGALPVNSGVSDATQPETSGADADSLIKLMSQSLLLARAVGSLNDLLGRNGLKEDPEELEMPELSAEPHLVEGV